MRLGLLSLMTVVALFAAVGCATPAKDATDIANDPAYTPPGQGELSIGADPAVKEKRAPRARHLQQPNQREVRSLRTVTMR
jgi:hypothetical protein